MRHNQRVESRKVQGTSNKLKVFGVVVLLSFTFSLSTVQAQTSVNASGGNALGSGGSVSYSVGQVVYTTNTGTNGSVAQGVQQPYEISVVTAIEEAKGINLSVSAYPNPTTDYLTLEVADFNLLPLTFHLFDMNGKLLQGGNKVTHNNACLVACNFCVL